MRGIALVDHTEELKPRAGVLEAIAAALTLQIKHDFAPAWGTQPRKVTVGGRGDEVHVLDSPEQAAQELGWHDVDDDGLPYAHVFVSNCVADSGWLSGPSSVAATIGHEVLEMLVDPCANEYAFDGYGHLWASEVCDPVQAHSYRITTGGRRVPMTNFVLPAFFNAFDAVGPWDHMGVLEGSFTLATGGYAVRQKAGRDRAKYARGFTVDFDDAIPKDQQRAKLAAFGRTYWRTQLLP